MVNIQRFHELEVGRKSTEHCKDPLSTVECQVTRIVMPLAQLETAIYLSKRMHRYISNLPTARQASRFESYTATARATGDLPTARIRPQSLPAGISRMDRERSSRLRPNSRLPSGANA